MIVAMLFALKALRMSSCSEAYSLSRISSLGVHSMQPYQLNRCEYPTLSMRRLKVVHMSASGGAAWRSANSRSIGIDQQHTLCSQLEQRCKESTQLEAVTDTYRGVRPF